MSALPSQLTITQFRPLPTARARRESTGTRTVQPWTALRAFGEQVRALFLVQRSLSGQSAHTPYSAEDDYHRFSNRSC